MNEKMNGGISTLRGIFCRLSFQKGGITAETIAAQGFDGGIFSVDTRQSPSEISEGLLLFIYVQIEARLSWYTRPQTSVSEANRPKGGS